MSGRAHLGGVGAEIGCGAVIPGYGVGGGGGEEVFRVMELDAMTPTKQQQQLMTRRGKQQREEGGDEKKSKRGGEGVWIAPLPGTPEHVESVEKMREEFEVWRRRAKSGVKNRVMLNVGGRLFETSKQTLNYDGQSMLAANVNRHMKDENEVIWIDRDPVRFRHVLNYLRSQTIWLDSVCELRAVQEEADFFNLDGLHKLCEARVQEILAEKDERQQMMQRLQGLHDTMKGLTESLENHKSGQRKEPISGVRRRRLDYGNYNEPVFRMDEDF